MPSTEDIHSICMAPSNKLPIRHLLRQRGLLDASRHPEVLLYALSLAYFLREILPDRTNI